MSDLPKLLPFERSWGNPQLTHPDLESLISQGKLPPDILFRLLTVGEYQPDPISPDGRKFPLSVALFRDAINNADDPDNARPETQRIIWGELPDVVVDLNRNRIDFGMELFPELYWGKKQLANVIQTRRLSEGKTITEDFTRFWYNSAEERERRYCSGLAQPVWRQLVARLHPDILTHPEWFYHSSTISFTTVYNLTLQTRRRRAITHSLISDVALRSLYEEIETTGMKGIGP